MDFDVNLVFYDFFYYVIWCYLFNYVIQVVIECFCKCN